MKYRVYGYAKVMVCVNVEADSADEAIDEAYNEFGGINSFAGNGGLDKLIGVSGKDESIELDGDVEFETVDIAKGR